MSNDGMRRYRVTVEMEIAAYNPGDFNVQLSEQMDALHCEADPESESVVLDWKVLEGPEDVGPVED